MEKLKFNLETLKVETFETSSIKEKKGTIIGNAPCTEAESGCGNSINYPTCNYESCNNHGSCEYTCVDLICIED